MMLQYEKGLQSTTIRMRQIPNTEYRDDIKKTKVKGQKKENKPIPFSCFHQSATSFLSPEHLNTRNTTEISFLMVSQIHSEQINSAQHLRDSTALQVHFSTISDGEQKRGNNNKKGFFQSENTGKCSVFNLKF